MLITYFWIASFNLFVYCHGYPSLLFATRKDVRIVNASRASSKHTIIARDLEEGVAVDYCYNRGLVCWTDHGLEMIQCIEYNGTHTGVKFKVVDVGVMSPDGLACDWITNKLYWTDVETNRIEVVSLDGRHRRVLFWDDIDQPRAIVLVPMKSIMFWTDWGEVPKIERASMDGSLESRQVIVSDDIFWPNGLTVDYDNEVIYWIDGKLKFLAVADYDGKRRKKLLTESIDYPYALTFFKNKLYWSDWKTWAIYEFNRTSVATPKKIVSGEAVPMDLHVYDRELQPYYETPCSKRNGGCSHLCLLSQESRGYKCDCPTGVKLIDDFTCANGSQEFLLIVQHTGIGRISLDSLDYTYFKIPLQGVKHAIAIDYDPIDSYIYWTDDSNKGLRRARLNGSEQEDIITTDVQHTDGLAVDWVSRNLYWTDTGTDRIEVATLRGQYRKVLINKDLQEPRAIAVAPNHGLLFWSDWREELPKIERANMDGSDRVTLVSHDLGWPNGIVLDLENDKLYWCDAKTDKFESILFDGNDRRQILSENLFHPFGLSLMDDNLYWTDWTLRTVERINRRTSNDREIIEDQIPNLMGLKAVKMNMKIIKNPCSDNNGGCSHLCLNRPGNNYTCACQIGYELTSDLRTCVVPVAFLLFTRKENIGRISIENNNNDVAIPVAGVTDASVLDFDKSEDRIYWADVKQKTISRAYMNGSDVEKVIESGLDSPRGLAVDWLSRNLYWTDAGLKRIEVARLNGTYRRVLVWRDVEEPTSLVLDPRDGHMYWADWGKRGYISKSAMDGSRKTNIASNIIRATGLTIDYATKQLYWTVVSSKPCVESCNLDGSNRRKIVQDGLVRPVALTLYQEFIYWSDAVSGNIERADKTTGYNRTTLETGLFNVTDILIYHSSRQSGWGQCIVNNGKCSQLCLGSGTKYNCSCSQHYKLAKDNKTCLGPTSFLLFSQKNSIHRLVPDTSDCPETMLSVQAKTVRSVTFDPVTQFIYWIDGRAQSIRKAMDTGQKSSVVLNYQQSDVRFHLYDLALDPYTRLLYWSCANTYTINVTRIDKSSEFSTDIVVYNATEKPRNIALHPEKSLLFWTDVGSKHRVMRSYVDGSQKTIVAGDLKELSALAVDREDDLVYFAHSKQIDVCDLDGKSRRELLSEVQVLSLAVHNNKLYYSDENGYVTRINKDDGKKMEIMTKHTTTDLISVKFPTSQQYKQHPCSSQNKYNSCSHICISLPTSSANTNTQTVVQQQQQQQQQQQTLVVGEQKNSLYDEHEQVSNYHRRKQNDRMEKYSNDLDVGAGTSVSSSNTRFRSVDDESSQLVVGGTDDWSRAVITNTRSVCACPLNQILHDDKRTCSVVPECPANQFTCLGRRNSSQKDCVPIEWMCDGQRDCLDASDEFDCPECKGDQFHCMSGECIDHRLVCDGRNQCPDGSDEAKCCRPGEFQCVKTGDCIQNTAVCDGWNNCDDNSDESAAVCGDKFRYTEAVSYQDSGMTAYIVVMCIALVAAVVFGVLLSLRCRRRCLGVPDVSLDSAGDPLSPKPFQSTTATKPRTQVRLSTLNGSTTSNSYDRNHITGASSSSTSNGVCSGGGAYPAETLNPPPSPATTTESRHCCNSVGSRYRPYRHYRAINQPPPPTPCSTDVCDESDYGYRPQTESEYMTYSRGTASECDSDPFPPPPTPSSCPPSPSSTYFNPLPPPPSPVNRHHQH